MTSLSCRIYGHLLALYPEDLRRDFGVEMSLVFAEDLAAARRQSGLHGVLRVWRWALYEFLRFGLVGLMTSPALRAPALGMAFSMVSLAAQFLFRRTHLDAAALALTFTTPLLPVVVIWRLRDSGVIPLDLSGRDEEP